MKVVIILFLSSVYHQHVHGNGSHCIDVNCTCLERELESALKDTTPFVGVPEDSLSFIGKYFSNAHNVSRALFPPQKAAAKFIKVRVKFYNYTNFTRIRYAEYIWTTSCVYGLLPRYVLTLLSLGTLYHNRDELELSVPEFCHGVPREKYMEYALSSLQDFALIPNSADGRLNTVQCVVKVNNTVSVDHDNLTFVKRVSYSLFIFQIFISAVGGVVSGIFIKERIPEKSEWPENNSGTQAIELKSEERTLLKQQDRSVTNKKKIKAILRREALEATCILVVGLHVVLLLVVVVLIGKALDSSIFLWLVFIVSLLNLFLCSITLILILLWRKKLDSIFFLSSFAVLYHFLWLLLGVFSNPIWSFSVLISIFSIFLLFYILVYYYRKENRTFSYVPVLVSGVIMIAFLLFIAFMWLSLTFFLTNQHISNLIQMVLMSILGLVFSLLSYYTPSFPVRNKEMAAEK